jgi:hypothetical protein
MAARSGERAGQGALSLDFVPVYPMHPPFGSYDSAISWRESCPVLMLCSHNARLDPTNFLSSSRIHPARGGLPSRPKSSSSGPQYEHHEVIDQHEDGLCTLASAKIAHGRSAFQHDLSMFSDVAATYRGHAGTSKQCQCGSMNYTRGFQEAPGPGPGARGRSERDAISFDRQCKDRRRPVFSRGGRLSHLFDPPLRSEPCWPSRGSSFLRSRAGQGGNVRP